MVRIFSHNHWKRMITDNKNSAVYNNVVKKLSWEKRNVLPLTTLNIGLHPKIVMLRHCKSIVHAEFFLPNQTTNSDKWWPKCDRIKSARNWPVRRTSSPWGQHQISCRFIDSAKICRGEIYHTITTHLFISI